MAANESFESEDLETNRENTDDLLAVQLAQTPENDDNFRYVSSVQGLLFGNLPHS